MLNKNPIVDMMAPDQMAQPGPGPMDALVNWYHSQGPGLPQTDPTGVSPMGNPMDQSMAGQEGQLSMQALQILKGYTG